MYEEEFALRLCQLRNQKGISAREMSLAIGQNPSYINNIERGKAMPSMGTFFYICEYLRIAPHDFFDTDTKNPEKVQQLIENVKKLDDTQLESVISIVKALVK
ncbi:MAG: helix-turn-helix transcriptional regulator [Clostridia bacterium]|nr:helix-turn-helix transcriptional regulator [Clostridia bacterium]